MSSISADVEIVRPALGDDGVYGVEGTGVPEQLHWRLGTAAQYERAPVQMLTEDQISSQPVSDRIGGWVGASFGVGYGLAVQAFVPVAWQQGDDPTLSANGVGLGDPRIGARWQALDSKLVDATLRADAYIPGGKQDAWLGEPKARGAFGVSGALDGGFGAVVADVGLMVRGSDELQDRFLWGPAAEMSVGLRADIGERFTATGAWVGRVVLDGLDAKDGELGSEALLGAQLQLSDAVLLGAGGGLGVQAGAGTSTFRGFLNATFSLVTEVHPRVEPVIVEAPRPPPDATALVVDEIEGIEIPPPPPPPAVEVVGDEIVYRGEIRFAVGSADLLPESKPTITAIADLLASDGRIAHMAIEGHASDEGSLAFNWDLSDRRARSVWEALILEGVAPERMSWRGLGEVSPSDTTGGRAANRAVVLTVARRLAQGEELTPVPPTALLPWNGETTALDTVTIPVVIKPPTEKIDPNAFTEDEEE